MGMSLPLAQLAFMDQLRGFVAVGRRLSITQAAEDLCLTQSAVSRQVQLLERRLGVKLLIRGHRHIAFTAEGERLFRSADAAMQQLQDIMGEIGGRALAKSVTISASIGVTGLWLLPRLHVFQKQYPALDIRISASNRAGDLDREGIDLAIRYTSARLAPARAIRLFNETIAPVAHPSLECKIQKSGKLGIKWPLLEFEEAGKPWLSWHDWLDKEAIQAARKTGILRFNQYDQLIHAAVAGHGVALGRMELIQDLIRDGRLVPLAAARTQGEAGHAYWLMEATAAQSKDVCQVKEWLLAEAGKTNGLSQSVA